MIPIYNLIEKNVKKKSTFIKNQEVNIISND